MSYLSMRGCEKCKEESVQLTQLPVTRYFLHIRHMYTAGWGNMYFSGNSGAFWGTYHDAWVINLSEKLSLPPKLQMIAKLQTPHFT